jgi:uncharacterized protein (TIGR00255 family)
MTGYGNASVQAGSKTVSAEIKSVNSKYFDLNLRLPSSYREKELELRTDLSRAIERGKVECTVTVESSETQKRASFNMDLLKAYHLEVRQVQQQLNLQDNTDVLRLLLTMPDVLVTESVDRIRQLPQQ